MTKPDATLPSDPTPAGGPARADVAAAVSLAHLLQRIDTAPAGTVSAGQYQALAQQLARALQALPPGPVLERLLQHLPVAAEVYENLHYAHAGLCRAPLEPALHAELGTRALIERVRQHRA